MAAKDAAKGIASTELLCECCVEGKPESKFRTATSKDHTTPSWNSEVELKDVDVSKDSLVFTVYAREVAAQGPGSEDFIGKATELASTDAEAILGKATLPAARFFPTAFDGELPLAGAGPNGGEAFLSVAAAVRAAKAGEEEDPPETCKGEAGVHQSGEDGEDGGLVSDEKVKAAMEAGLDKELEARVQTRAYYLWENGSLAGAEADYFEALRVELSEAAPEDARLPQAAAAAGA